MKTKSTKTIGLGLVMALSGVISLSSAAQAFTDPSSVRIKIYEIRLSHASDCSNSVRIVNNPGGAVTDFVTNPTIGAGAVPNGAYQCIMVKLSNLITFTPASTDNNCVAVTSYTRNVFQAPGGGQTNSIDPDGNVLVFATNKANSNVA